MTMILYFAPLACSMASRIALYEAGIDAEFQEVELLSKTLTGGGDYRSINPKGQVPALVLDDGRLVTEGPVVLLTIAALAPAAALAPPVGCEAPAELQAWLNMIATELHSGVFVPFMHPASPPDAKAFARLRVEPRYDYLESYLTNHHFLMAEFSVADAYLVTVLGWSEHCGIDLGRWPALAAYRARLRARPSVARAMGEEMALRQAA